MPLLPVQEGNKGMPEAKGRKRQSDPVAESKGGLKSMKTFLEERPAMKGNEGALEDSAEDRLPLSEGDETQQKLEAEDKDRAELGGSAMIRRWENDDGL